MEDILPYLGVQPSYDPQETRPVIMPDLVGLTTKEASAALKNLGLTAVQRGTEDTVTAQIVNAVYIGSGILRTGLCRKISLHRCVDRRCRHMVPLIAQYPHSLKAFRAVRIFFSVIVVTGVHLAGAAVHVHDVGADGVEEVTVMADHQSQRLAIQQGIHGAVVQADGILKITDFNAVLQLQHLCRFQRSN